MKAPKHKFQFFRSQLLSWHQTVDRALPWKSTKDPYTIWVSEIILQQTRLAQGLPYYKRFISRFPDIQGLANASQEEVLTAWKGLGYYNRAINMHKSARIIVSAHNGNFPKSFKQLILLPGIGHYTAAAIASFAFDEPCAVLDGNVYRVLGRVFNIDLNIQSAEGKRKYIDISHKALDKSFPATYNQAIMDFGALVCTPSNPSCENCCMKKICLARLNGTVEKRPVKNKAKSRKKRYMYFFVLEKAGKIALQKRKSNDIWKGLYQLPAIETEKPMEDLICIKKQLLRHWKIDPEQRISFLEKRRQILSHQEIIACFHSIQKAPKTLIDKWTNIEDLSTTPTPGVIDRFLKARYIEAGPGVNFS